MTNISSSIIILNHFARQVGIRVKILTDSEAIQSWQTDINMTFVQTFVYAIILDTCSYLDEYNDYFGVISEEDCKERVLMMKKITKPFIKKIKEWKDLNIFRNNVVAHNLRDRGNFVFWDDISKYNIPRTINDVYLLNNCLQFSQNYISQEFTSELEHGVSQINTKVNTPYKIIDKEYVSATTVELFYQAEEAAKFFNKNYSLPAYEPEIWNKI